jgi:hypothetical protein
MFNTVSHAFKQVRANLGKADSAVFDDTLGGKQRNELLNESQFASVEANIKDDLIRNIGPIRRQNCIDAVKREAQVMQDGLTEIVRKLDDRIRETKSRMDAIVRFKSQFRDYMLTTPRDGSNPAVDEVRMVSNGHFNPAKYLRALHYCHDFEFNGGYFSAAKLQKLITLQRDDLMKQMKDDIRAITSDDFVLALRRNGERRNNICKYVHEAFRDFALRMLKADCIKFGPLFSADEAETLIRSTVERLQMPDLQDGFFVNVDSAVGKAPVSVRKLNDWRNLIWEFRKRNADEAKAVFAEYFNPSTEGGPFAEMIEAVAVKVREAVVVWMNETAFDALRTDFIRGIEKELDRRLLIGQNELKAVTADCSAIQKMMHMCESVNSVMNEF